MKLNFVMTRLMPPHPALHRKMECVCDEEHTL